MGIQDKSPSGFGSLLNPFHLHFRLNESSILPAETLANSHAKSTHLGFPEMIGYLFVPAVSINTT